MAHPGLPAVAVIALLAALAFQCPDGSPPPCARPAARAPQGASVAVLYFDNLSRDSNDAYLADGLTEQTIAQLGEVPRLTVASRYAVRRFKGAGAAQDPAAIGRSLNVAYLVNGSVQRVGSRLRVGVELLRAGTGVRVWGENYDRTDTDLLRLQDDIAAAVATGIVGRLLPTERTAIAARSTRSGPAYDHFLRGNFHLAQRTPQAIQLAIRDYQAALAIDPSFTDALARVAYAYALVLDNEYDIGISRDTAVARALDLARRAVARDSMSSDGWMALAYARQGADPHRMTGTREAYERALRLNPRNAEAHHQFASHLNYMGDTAGSRAENMRALELEPGRAITWSALADLWWKIGWYRDAIAAGDSALATDPAFALGSIMKFLAAVQLPDTALARRAVTVMQAQPAITALGNLLGTMLTALAGDTATRNGLVAFLDGNPGALNPSPIGNQINNGFFAAFATMLGAHETALRALETTRPRGVRLHDIMRAREFDPIRTMPRFQALWRETMPPGATW